MKTRLLHRCLFCLALACLASGSAVRAGDAQTNRPAQTNSLQIDSQANTRATEKLGTVDKSPSRATPPVGGAVPDMIKSGNPLQALNPMAPKRYGSGETNVVRDPITGKARGIALFSFHF
jgi:hypothetical protein